MQKKADFIIRRGELLAYVGSDPVVRVPKGVRSIGQLAFSDNPLLEEVALPEGLQRIGECAFIDCASLRRVSLPESLRFIEDYAFSGCASLRDIRLPSEMVGLGEGVFWNCGSLTELALPRNLHWIPARLLQFCRSLKKIALPDQFFQIGHHAFCYTGISSLELPDGLQQIGEGAFSFCKQLKKVTMPDTVSELGDCAFSGCVKLTEIELPEPLQALGSFVFSGCDRLKRIVFRGRDCAIRSNSLGYRLPPSLAPQLGELWPRMTDGALKQYVLDEKGWASLLDEARCEVFLARHGKSLLPLYRERIDAGKAELLGEELLERASELAPVKARNALRAFHALFGDVVRFDLAARYEAEISAAKPRRTKKAAPDAAENAGTERVLKALQVGALTKRYVSRGGLIWQEYVAKTDRADVCLSFIVTTATPENEAAAAAEWLPTGLSSSVRNGLCAVLRRSEEPDETGELLPDGELGGNAGICDTDLSVQRGRLIYTISPCSVGCDGAGRIDLGAATRHRAAVVSDTCFRFEQNWLIPFSWSIKHEFIDSNGYEDWTPEDEDDCE